MPLAWSIERSGLLRRLQSARPGTTIVIVAPAGFGKSTLIDQIREHETNCAFVDLGPHLDDPAGFGAALAAALSPRDRPVAADATDVPEVGSAAFVDVVIDLLEAPDGPGLLILDDLHRLSNSTVLEAIGNIASRLITKRLLLASRRSPPIGLSRLKVRQRLVEIDERDLALDEDGVINLLTDIAPGIEITPQVMADAARLRGWPAGLVLYGLPLSRGQLGRSLDAEADMREYVRDEVLATLPPDLREFLLELALIGTFRADIAAKITRRPNAATLLDELILRHLFIESDRAHHGWLCFHDLFGDVLRRQAHDLGEQRRNEIEVRTVKELMDTGEIDIAVERILHIDDSDNVLELLADFDDYGNSNQRVYALFLRRDFVHVGKVMSKVPVAALPPDPTPLGIALMLALADYDLVRAGGVRNALALVQDWANPEVGPFFPALEGLHAHLSGNIPHAIDVFQFAAIGVSAPGWRDSMLAYLVLGGIVEPLFMAGRFDECLVACDETIALGERGDFRSFQPTMHATVGIIHVLRGDAAAATVALAAAERTLERSRRWWDVALTATLDAMLHEQRGDLETARSLLLAAMSDVTFNRACISSALQYLIVASIEQKLGRFAECDARLAAARQLTAHAVGMDLYSGFIATLDASRRNDDSPIDDELTVQSLHELSDRERSVLRLLRSRLTLREIANELILSPNTVKTHTQSIYRKLGVGTRSEAVELFQERSLRVGV